MEQVMGDKLRAGYTVLEVLLVIAILAIIAVASTNLLFSSLGGSSKASAVAIVKQNGDHAISILEKEVRLAKQADCPLPRDTLALYDDLGNSNIFQIQGNRVQITDESGVPSFLTSDRLVAANFNCEVFPGAFPSDPETVAVSFELTIAPGGDPKESFNQRFQARVSLRTY
jgi:prepilin-type N-terminal cleavage/methylation domain-containing protein